MKVLLRTLKKVVKFSDLERFQTFVRSDDYNESPKLFIKTSETSARSIDDNNPGQLHNVLGNFDVIPFSIKDAKIIDRKVTPFDKLDLYTKFVFADLAWVPFMKLEPSVAISLSNGDIIRNINPLDRLTKNVDLASISGELDV